MTEFDFSRLDVSPRFGKPAPLVTPELRRIMALPRRQLSVWTPEHVAALEARLSRVPVTDARVGWPCVCRQQARDCPLHLRPVQAYMLLEAPYGRHGLGGAIGSIGVGNGKTLLDLELAMVMPGCRVAVLLISAQLVPQLMDEDIPYYGAHWRIPYVVGRSGLTDCNDTTLPRLHVVTYEKLSQQDGTSLLRRINPDLIIADEAQKLADAESVRTDRFLRFMAEHPATRFVPLTGSFMARSMEQTWHLGALALADGSPIPITKSVIEEWALALDPPKGQDPIVAPPGALAAFTGDPTCKDTETVRLAIQARMRETLGFIGSGNNEDIEARLVISRHVVEVPVEIEAAIHMARAGERPDSMAPGAPPGTQGEQFVEQLQVTACVRQLASGFFHRWKYPRGEPPELILKWFALRQAWNRVVRDELKHPAEGYDSPGYIEKAAERGRLGMCDPALPSVRFPEWDAWVEVRDLVQPEPEAVWLHDFIVQDAARWACDHAGIVWVEFPELGERIAQAAGVPWFGGGDEASAAIKRETGKRSIVASIWAHREGKNLQRFAENLVVNPPGSGDIWEQMAGRTYRSGQRAPVVRIEVCLHTDEYARAFSNAYAEAKFSEQMKGNPQRLCFARYE